MPRTPETFPLKSDGPLSQATSTVDILPCQKLTNVRRHLFFLARVWQRGQIDQYRLKLTISRNQFCRCWVYDQQGVKTRNNLAIFRWLILIPSLYFARMLHTIFDRQVTKNRNKVAILLLIPSPSCQREQSCAACKALSKRSCQEGCCPCIKV